MGYIGNEAQTAFTSFDKQTITGTGTSVYTLSHNVANEQEIEVFVNNVRQEGGSGKAFTVSGNQITFSENIASTDTVYVNFAGKAIQTVSHPSNQPLQATSGAFSSTLSVTGATTATGGIKLGGTASANLLDNYYEDTWSPYFSDINGNAIFNQSPTVNTATYQRIGDFVTLHTYFGNAASVTTTASYGATNATYIGGLPFAVPSGAYYAGIISYQAALSGPSNQSLYDSGNAGVPLSVITEAGYSVLRLHYALGTTMVGLQNQYISGSTALILSCTYKVTS